MVGIYPTNTVRRWYSHLESQLYTFTIFFTTENLLFQPTKGEQTMRPSDKPGKQKKSILAAICLSSLVMTASNAQSEKVVVVPLGSKTFIEASIYWIGAWQENMIYKLGDAIQYDGSSYLCIQDHTSSSAILPTDSTYWDLMAAKGTKGDTGDPGAKGDPGTPGAKGDTGDPGADGPGIADMSCQEGSYVIGFAANLPICSPLPPHTVFLTSDRFNGAIGSIAAADLKCQNQADAASLAGTYKAWLSTKVPVYSPATDWPASRDREYQLPDGTVVATDWADLTDGSIGHTINQHADGTEDLSGWVIWTGTNPDGSVVVADSTCDDWTGTTGTGKLGNNSDTNTRWTSSHDSACDSEWTKMYCFQQ